MANQPNASLNRSAQIQEALRLMDMGDVVAAEECIRAVLDKNAKESIPWNVLGVILKRQSRLAEAVDAFLLATKYDPKNYSPMVNLGNSYMDLGQVDKALEQYGKAVRVAPKIGEHHRLLAIALRAAGDIKKALASLQTASILAPKDIRVRVDFASIYMAQQKFEEALKEMERALLIAPENTDLIRNKSVILNKMGRTEDSKTYLDKMIAQNPNDISAYIAMGTMYHYDMGDFKKANSYFERAYAIDPNNTQLLAKYCECLLNSRYDSEAMHIQHAYEIAKRLVELGDVPMDIRDSLQKVFLRTVDFEMIAKLGTQDELMDYWLQRMNVGALMNQLGRVKNMADRHMLVTLHKQWGNKVENGIPPVARPAIIQKHDKIRIGFMSSDLRDHPVTYFVQPYIEFFDRKGFELYCYSFYTKEADKVQDYIVNRVTEFRLMPGASDVAVATQIAKDQVDILFELGGTTFLNKVHVCSHRAAPVQVSWLGYPHSVGLSQIDYILTDPYITPKEPGLLIEQPFEMPNSWVTLGQVGFHDVPINANAPHVENGFITFGTMNNPYKYTPDTIAAWAKIMMQVPGSKFLFVRPEGGTPAFCENIARAFGVYGVSPERIMFEPRRGKHMPFYNKFDIALDSFPHTGGTTTCETIWMGVPCVTLVGPAFFERLSYSNLSNVGLGDLCAFTQDDYIRIAVELARNNARIQDLRQNLRAQIRRMPLGDQIKWVRDFEAKITSVLNSHKSIAA